MIFDLRPTSCRPKVGLCPTILGFAQTLPRPLVWLSKIYDFWTLLGVFDPPGLPPGVHHRWLETSSPSTQTSFGRGPRGPDPWPPDGFSIHMGVRTPNPPDLGSWPPFWPQILQIWGQNGSRPSVGRSQPPVGTQNPSGFGQNPLDFGSDPWSDIKNLRFLMQNPRFWPSTLWVLVQAERISHIWRLQDLGPGKCPEGPEKGLGSILDNFGHFSITFGPLFHQFWIRIWGPLYSFAHRKWLVGFGTPRGGREKWSDIDFHHFRKCDIWVRPPKPENDICEICLGDDDARLCKSDPFGTFESFCVHTKCYYRFAYIFLHFSSFGKSGTWKSPPRQISTSFSDLLSRSWQHDGEIRCFRHQNQTWFWLKKRCFLGVTKVHKTTHPFQ